MSILLERCADLPTRGVPPGEVLLEAGTAAEEMYVLVAGSFEVASQGSVVAIISEPGAVIGEISTLLSTPPGATVTAISAATVHVLEQPLQFISTDAEVLMEIAQTLAGRLNRLVVYLADIKKQYGGSDGHLGLLDEVLSELTFGQQVAVESGSEREPESFY